MSKPLQVGTTASFPFGPFITTAGVAATDLTINASNVFISKNDAALVKLNNTGTALAHDEDGFYTLTLDVTDLNAVGPGIVETNSASALHVWTDIQVMTVPGYKFLYGAIGASHVDQVFEDLSSLLNQTSALIQDSTLIKVSLSSILGETTILIADTSSLKVDSTAIKVALTNLAIDTTAMKVSLSSILNETTVILADTSALKVDSTAIKTALSSISTRVEELQADTTSLKVSMSSALNQSSALIDDSTVIKAQLTSISTGVTRILEDTTILKVDSTLMKVSLSSLLNESTAIITAISGIPATVLGVVNSQVIDSTITRLEAERIGLAALAGETSGAGTSAVKFFAAGTSAPAVARITGVQTTLGERTGVVLNGSPT